MKIIALSLLLSSYLFADVSLLGKAGMGISMSGEPEIKTSFGISSKIMFNKIVGIEPELFCSAYTQKVDGLTTMMQWNNRTRQYVFEDKCSAAKIRHSYMEIPVFIRFDIPAKRVQPYAGIGLVLSGSMGWYKTTVNTDAGKEMYNSQFSGTKDDTLFLKESLDIIFEPRGRISEICGIEIPAGKGVVQLEERWYIRDQIQLYAGYGVRFGGKSKG